LLPLLSSGAAPSWSSLAHLGVKMGYRWSLETEP
jgi:hypothetical protein